MITQEQESINNLQSNLEYFITQLNQVKSNVSDNQIKINNLQNICITGQSEIANIQTDINQLNQEICTNQEEINVLWQEIEAISGEGQVISASPNTDVTITNTIGRLWLFIGSVKSYSNCPHDIKASLLVDGAQIDSWIQGRQNLHYWAHFNFNFIKLYLLPAGTHTVNFDYELRSYCSCNQAWVRGHSFMCIALK